MIIALAARKEALEMKLKEKTEELKRICFQEAVRESYDITYVIIRVSKDACMWL